MAFDFFDEEEFSDELEDRDLLPSGDIGESLYEPSSGLSPIFAPNRQSLLATQQSQIGELKKETRSAMQDLFARKDKLSPEEVASTALLTILPIVLGAAAHGKAGLAYGAKAATGGAGVYLSGTQAEKERERRRAELEFKTSNEALKRRETEAAKTQENMFSAEERARLQEERIKAQDARSAANRAALSGGLSSIGKGLDVLGKSLDVREKQASLAAKTDKIVVDTGPYESNKIIFDRSSIDPKNEAAQTKAQEFEAGYNKIFNAINGIQNILVSSSKPEQVVSKGAQLSSLIAEARQAYTDLMTVRGNKVEQGRVEAIFPDPSSLWENIKAGTLPVPQLEQKFANLASQMKNSMVQDFKSLNATIVASDIKGSISTANKIYKSPTGQFYKVIYDEAGEPVEVPVEVETLPDGRMRLVQ